MRLYLQTDSRTDWRRIRPWLRAHRGCRVQELSRP